MKGKLWPRGEIPEKWWEAQKILNLITNLKLDLIKIEIDKLRPSRVKYEDWEDETLP